MEATNTEFYAYQFKPVLRFLMSPTNSLLIADEVGLGKTIEAGLIWTELKSRFDFRRLLILCPAILREKWEYELREKIGVRADTVDSNGLLERLKDPASRLRGFAAICSLQGLRPPRNWEETDIATGPAELARLLNARANDEPLIDLLIIDEAHYLRNPDSQTYELGRLIRPVTENLLLLSATPIHNQNRDLFSLLQLLDGDTFERPEDLTSILQASQPLVRARDQILGPNPKLERIQELLDQAARLPLLRGNRQLQLAREESQNQKQLRSPDGRARLARLLETVNPLAYLITRTRKRDVKEWRVVREAIPESIQMSSHEKRFYDHVTAFVIDYAMSRAAAERFVLATPQRQMSSSMAATLRAWLQRKDNVDEILVATSDGKRTQNEFLGPLSRAIIENASNFGNLDDLIMFDSKYNRLCNILLKFFTDHPGEKAVLFSTFRETLNYLGERLSKDGIPSLVMHGGTRRPKDETLETFRSDPNVRVLLSSEIGSEGIDLQFCRVLINYDLPWNPMRIEQRIGRLDRLGQTASSIVIWNLLYDCTIDARIYERLYEKLNLCQQAMGDFEAVLGDEIRRLTADLLSGHLTVAQQEARIDQTAQALANLKHEQHSLEDQATHLIAYGDYILNEVQAARELNRWIDGEDLRAYTIDFFNTYYTGCRFFQSGTGVPNEYEAQLSNQAKLDLDQFVRTKKLMPTRLTHSSTQPVLCRFENHTTASHKVGGELISQFHPLVRFVNASISPTTAQLRPAISVQIAIENCRNIVPGGFYVLAVARWSVEGLQPIERLAFAAAKLDGEAVEISAADAERLASACARYGADWFEAKAIVDVERAADLADDVLFGELDQQFHQYVEQVKRENEDRADLQVRNLERHLEKQRGQLRTIGERHKLLGRVSLAKATEGRFQALENRIQQRIGSINSRRAIRYASEEIFVAIVNVVDRIES